MNRFSNTEWQILFRTGRLVKVATSRAGLAYSSRNEPKRIFSFHWIFSIIKSATELGWAVFYKPLTYDYPACSL